MTTIRTILRPVAFVLGLAFASAPMAARADEKPEVVQEQGKQNRNRLNFPMKADAFRQIVENRIEKARARLDAMLENRNLPPGIEAQIKKDFDAGAALVRTAAETVAADGTVTKEEAKEVRELAKTLRDQLRDKYAGKGKGREKNAERREGKGN